MRLLTGKMIGQSGQELIIAVFFSFIIHVIFLFAAIFLYMRTTPKISVPPFYEVALVAQPTGLPEVPSQAPPAETKQETKLKGHKEPAASKKGAMPELGKQKPAREESDEHEGKSIKATAPAGQPVSVTVTTAQAFKFPWYMAIIHDKIERHWNPPPGAREMKTKITFSILRSGQVGEAKPEVPSGNFYFDQAAMRAILTSSPFPPLPEGFFKESIEVSVDLMPEE